MMLTKSEFRSNGTRALNERMAELCGLMFSEHYPRVYQNTPTSPLWFCLQPDWEEHGGKRVPWNPAEDLGQAVEYVAAAMEGKRWHLVLMQYSESWSAVFTPPSECIGSGRFANDESPARAICEAALKAMG
jgi:hypothetical protein